MIKNLNSMEGQEDLRIVEHLDMQISHETLRLFETPDFTYYAGFKAIAKRVSESHSLTAKFCRIPFDLIDDVCRDAIPTKWTLLLQGVGRWLEG